MPLLAHLIRLEEPGAEFVIDILDVVQPEYVHVIPRRVGLDFAKPPALDAPGQNKVAIEPSPSRRDLRKRHPHLKRNPSLLRQHTNRTDASDLGTNGVEEAANLRWLAFKVWSK
jgi:hypothetical protein